MSVRRAFIVIGVILFAALGMAAAAPVVYPQAHETLVEGHTVFTLLETTAFVPGVNHTDYAAAVAVLVREINTADSSFRFPGVLWFNDQYLVDPVNASANEEAIRYPCTGAVLAVNRGDADPRAAFSNSTPPTYRFSYHIVDPNDAQWDVDAWNYTDPMGAFENIWTVAILNNEPGSDTSDDGASNCYPVTETTIREDLSPLPPFNWTVRPLARPDSGYMDGQAHGAKYNAVLYFNITDLSVRSFDKNHTAGSTDSANDVSGCQAGTTPTNSAEDTWSCPGNDDNREGNSHPYNPFIGTQGCWSCTGTYAKHGGSGSGGSRTHSTWDIDLYYGTAPVPAARSYPFTDTDDNGALGAPFAQYK